MASNSYLTKNSQYVASLVDFIKDTKPYHSKLTEIVEEYQFFDEMHVHFEERNSLKSEIDSAWTYSFSSGGAGGLTTMSLKQLHSPAAPVWPLNLNAPYGSIKVGRDEVTDLVGIPYVYSKKAFDQVGIADVLIERNGNRSTVEPLVEGLDWFQSHGSIQLQIKQTTDANTNFVPSWADTRDENIVATASANTRRLENDNTVPTSALRRILGMMQDIQALPGVSATSQALLTSIITPLLTVQDYVGLRNSAIADGVVVSPASLTGYKLVVYLQERYSMLSAGTISLLNAILSTLDSMLLTRDYEPLLNQLSADGTPFLPGYNGWIGDNGVPLGAKYVDEQLTDWTPSLYFNFYGDAALRESGKAEYKNIVTPFLNITNIRTTAAAVAGDTWRVIAVDSAVAQYIVMSELTGYVGEFTIPVDGMFAFTSSTISFFATWIAQPAIDQFVVIENRNRLVFGPTAPLETWNIIKVNPLAYTRPALVSTRYGWIEDQAAVQGLVTLLDTGLPTGTIILTARVGGEYFDLTSTAEPSYTGLVQVNVPYNDGRLAFTIRSGSAYTFNAGDRFYIDIQNDPAQIVDLDLGYGYDLDSYDFPDLVYNNTSSSNADYQRHINFVFDTRFTDYNFDSLNLTIAQTAISGRKWRIRAVPDLARPIATIKKDGSGPSSSVDLQESTSGVSPDPALTAAPLYSMLGDSNPAPDLNLYYATVFVVEYSDDNFNTVVSAGTVNVGSTYTNLSQGVSFTLAAGSKPFIAAVADDGLANPSVQGGDVFSFGVQNNPPILREKPIGLTSQFAPRLIMHGDGFHEAPAANWTISFSSANNWSLNGLYTVAPNVGLPVAGTPVTGTLSLSGVAANEGHSYEGLGVHYTIVDGVAGFGAGDSFEFTTFARKPSFLVHGSVSGWQPEAVVGERYWNGIIGFKIESPTAQLFNVTSTPALVPGPATNQWQLGTGILSLTRIRFDAPALIYSLTPVPIGSATPAGWTVHRSDIGTVGFLSRTGTFKDQYVTIDTPTDVPAANCIPLKLEITPDDFVLWNAQDVVILRPNIAARLPASTDFVLVDKRTVDTLAINLDYSALDTPPSLAALAPTNIDVRFIDTYTGSAGVPIKTYSPEVELIENWLPLSIVQRDSTTSTAVFTDRATQFDVVSNATGQTIGKLYSSSVDGNWPALFEWNSTFYNTYLPLNAAANIVVYSRNGFNDILNVRISESVKFLVSGGALTTDYMFTDPVNIHIAEHSDWTIFQQLQDKAIANIDDGPFGGFLAGYDNLPYDEDTYGYDTGFPLVDHFLQAKKLASLPSPTTAQQALLTSLIGTIGYYLEGGNLANTELYEFLADIDADTIPPGWVEPSGSFGLPKLGMGMDITIGAAGADATKPSTETSSASVLDALVVLAIDTPIDHDAFGFDFGGLDAQAERTAVIYSGELPPVPNPLVPSATYAEFETPLAVVKDPDVPTDFQARIFEINFRVTPANLASVQAMPNPKVFIWLPSWTAPQQIAVVDKIGTGKYRVSVPSSTEAKLYLQPGP